MFSSTVFCVFWVTHFTHVNIWVMGSSCSVYLQVNCGVVCSGGRVHYVVLILTIAKCQPKFRCNLITGQDLPWSKIAGGFCQDRNLRFLKLCLYVFFPFNSQHFITLRNYSSDYENDRYLIKICENCSQQGRRISSPNDNFFLSLSTFQNYFLTMRHLLLSVTVTHLSRSLLILIGIWKSVGWFWFEMKERKDFVVVVVSLFLP